MGFPEIPLGSSEPDPSIVIPHTGNHEDGGSDEINVEGLDGVLAEGQHAIPAEVKAISINNLVEDLTPQLGGDLDSNGHAINSPTDPINEHGVGDQGFNDERYPLIIIVKCIADNTTLTTGNGKAHLTIPAGLNGTNLIGVAVHVYTVSSGGLPTFQVHNLTDGVDMLSTEITIDVNEKDSKDAATPAVIDIAHDDVATGDELRFDCDVAGTDTRGMEIRLRFR